MLEANWGARTEPAARYCHTQFSPFGKVQGIVGIARRDRHSAHFVLARKEQNLSCISSTSFGAIVGELNVLGKCFEFVIGGHGVGGRCNEGRLQLGDRAWRYMCIFGSGVSAKC